MNLVIKCVMFLCVGAGIALAQGWQPEQQLWSGNGGNGDQKITCAAFPGVTETVCIFEIGSTLYEHLNEIDSFDGGVTWTSPVQITNDSPSEFDCSIRADTGRGRLSLIYSRNGVAGGNDIEIRHKTCSSCGWTIPVTVVADGHNNWDASLLVAGNGDLLVLETLEGFGGNGSPGTIHSFRSTDGGEAWGPRTNIISTSGQQWFPVAVQKSDGIIHLMFRDTTYSSNAQIGQMWSSDYGDTWTGFSNFMFNRSQQRLFSFIGTQGGINLTVLAGIGGVIHHWQSWDNGNTWQGPYITSSISPAQDAEFSLGCRGVIFTFTGPNTSAYEKRYDWYTSCQ